MWNILRKKPTWYSPDSQFFLTRIKKCVPGGTYHEYLPGGSLCVLSKKTKIKYDFEDSISNVDLSSAAK